MSHAAPRGEGAGDAADGKSFNRSADVARSRRRAFDCECIQLCQVLAVHQRPANILASRYADRLAFDRLTGCPVIVNTSFNVRGEPIVGTPEDAFRCFMGTGIETLAVGNCFLRKEAQDPALKERYETQFELD